MAIERVRLPAEGKTRISRHEPQTHGSTLPFDKLTALSDVEGLTVPERSRGEKRGLRYSARCGLWGTVAQTPPLGLRLVDRLLYRPEHNA
jgi:hypothetical protein